MTKRQNRVLVVTLIATASALIDTIAITIKALFMPLPARDVFDWLAGLCIFILLIAALRTRD